MADDTLTFIATLGGTSLGWWGVKVLQTVIGLGLALLLARFRIAIQLTFVVFLVALAIPVADHAETFLGVKDDRSIVIDEAMTFPVATLGLPLWRHPWLLPGALVTSWVLDNRKPPPVAQAQSLPGGTGIVLDDVLANLYTLLLAHLALWLYRRKRRGQSGADG